MCQAHQTQATETSHPWERMGLGKAPYRCVGMCQIPSVSLCEANPIAYEIAMRALPHDFHVGSCHVCGAGLVYNYMILSADGHKFVVGCECVMKLGMSDKLTAEVRAEKAKLLKAQRAARNELKHAARVAAWAEENKARAEQFKAANAAFIIKLAQYADGNEFLASLLSQIDSKGYLSDRQMEVAYSAFKRADQYAAEQAELAEFLKINRYLGNEGERVEVEAVLDRVISFEGYDFSGRPCTKFITRMLTAAGHAITYFGCLNAKTPDGSSYIGHKGDKLLLKATVKKHEEYKGVKQMTVQRPVAKLLLAA